MSNVNSHLDNGKLIVEISGHVDSSNSAALEADINKIRTDHPEGDIVLDALHLEYISSAGLRVILRLSQKEDSLKLINVSSAVYEVLEMTGFTEMLTIEKAYRVISIEGCEIIGQGANGKVYRLDPDTIIKVYNNPDSLPEINRERELARKAFVLGIPTAIPYDVVKVGSGYGSVFELLNAKSFSNLINSNPENIDTYIKLYVDLLKKIHSTEVGEGEMPSIKETALNWAEFLKDYLPSEQSGKLIKLIQDVPSRHTMIHGDYHTKNVMMQNNEVLLIDMDTLSYGHPIFELASMYLAYEGFGIIDRNAITDFMGIPYETAVDFFHRSVKMYLNTEDEKRYQEVKDKAMLVGFTRLMRRTIRRYGLESEKGKPLAEACKKNIIELLGRVDSLDF
ncbi:MAG: phosphotransferase [Bacilli bacterium]|jgi:uncharacterized protein (TIGR02172 family)|nr:phosphotransferase [Bacilli bacterium]